MNKPYISIIVPVYNTQKYISACLDSLTRQTFEDIEIICIDDYSSDDSVNIAQTYAVKDERIKIIKLNERSGVSKARNIAIKSSSCPYIMFCDSDDKYHPQMCEKMFKAISENKVDAAICAAEVVYETSKKPNDIPEQNFSIMPEGIKILNDKAIALASSSIWNKIFKRDIINARNLAFPDVLINEDGFFWNAYACVCQNAFFLNEKLYRYTRRQNSAVDLMYFKIEDYSLSYLKTAEALYDFFMANGIYKQKKTFFWEEFFKYCLWTLKHSHADLTDNFIYGKANELINKFNPSKESFDEETNLKIAAIKNKRLKRKTWRFPFAWLPIIKTTRTFKKLKIWFLGIPVWKVKYKINAKIYCLLAFIPVLKTKTEN
ncbi:MAG: glycosyltransferase [Endomicrobium sp.]|jgi:glycosyltransferase involved in cell wall biosynthesis|nr:glycosyltransferase [Endomicrobium sp.]